MALTLPVNCIITNKIYSEAVGSGNPVAWINNPTNETFKIIDTKLYVPVVTSSTQDHNKLLDQLKTGLKRTIKWTKYRSEMPNETKNKNLNYLIVPTFLLKSKDYLSSQLKTKISFSKYYTPSVDIKDFNVLIDGKSLFWHFCK